MPEHDEETRSHLSETLKTFFTDTMEIEQAIEISDVYRIGKAVPHTTVVKLKYPNDKAIIYAHSKNLKGKENSKKKGYFIKDDTTEEQDEVRRRYRDLIQQNVEQEEDKKFNSIKMHKGEVYVNNTKVCQHVRPPGNSEVLRYDHDQLDDIKSVKLIKGAEHSEKGSDFVSYAFKAKSVKEVNKAYSKIKVKFGDATHISCAYQLENAFGPYRQEAIDDGDIGIGREILQVMKDKEIEYAGVFIVRHYGGTHLGKRRFEIAQALTTKALQSFFHKSTTRKRWPRVDSQSSITSIASTLSQYDSLEEDNNTMVSAAANR